MVRVVTDKRKKGRLLLIASVAVFCCISGVAAFFALGGRALLTPPGWVTWQEKEICDEDLKLVVKGQKAALFPAGEKTSPAWESDRSLKVQDGFLADVDRDGDTEMVLLLWKRGRFGQHRPFWISSDEKTFSQHIFIYDVNESGTVKNKWFASDIGRDVLRMKLMKEDPAIFLTETGNGECFLWAWESFGLKVLDNEVSFLAYGDNIIHDGIIEYANRSENGRYDFLYEPFLDEIRSADIAAIQAETVLVDKASAVLGYPSFGSPLAVGEAIRDAGFDVAVCANNHALDRGIYGIDVTDSFYRDNGITCIGIQGSGEKNYRPYEVISKNGIRFALFSYTYGTNAGDVSDKYPGAVHYLPGTEDEERKFVSELQDARKDSDFVVVFVHWGEEYETAVTDEQRSVTKLLSEGGADVVIGSHSHVVQDTEVIERPDGGQMLVYYSLGNFRADQKGERNGADTAVGAKAVFTVEHCFDGVRLKDWEMGSVDAFWKSR
jgi:poly-gamma-glutamate capsule biosynthesis protein CapA/YwtB (metallophosphatase superfamily)